MSDGTSPDTKTKVFIMWSGELSRRVAELLSEFLVDAMQGVQPFLSTHSIGKGQLWMSTIGAGLEASSFGIACMTSDNLDAKWIHFEAGAIAKHASEARVATLRINVEQAAITGPLANFHDTNLSDNEDFLKLLLSIDEKSLHPIGAARLRRIFDKFWPELLDRVGTAVREAGTGATPQTSAPPVSDRAILQEVLQLTREMSRVVGSLDLTEAARGSPFRDALMKLLSGGETDEPARRVGTGWHKAVVTGGPNHTAISFSLLSAVDKKAYIQWLMNNGAASDQSCRRRRYDDIVMARHNTFH